MLASAPRIHESPLASHGIMFGVEGIEMRVGANFATEDQRCREARGRVTTLAVSPCLRTGEVFDNNVGVC